MPSWLLGRLLYWSESREERGWRTWPSGRTSVSGLSVQWICPSASVDMTKPHAPFPSQGCSRLLFLSQSIHHQEALGKLLKFQDCAHHQGMKMPYCTNLPLKGLQHPPLLLRKSSRSWAGFTGPCQSLPEPPGFWQGTRGTLQWSSQGTTCKGMGRIKGNQERMRKSPGMATALVEDATLLGLNL